MSLTIIGDGAIVSDKAAGLLTLNRQGFEVPETLIVGDVRLDEDIAGLVERTAPADHYYVRLACREQDLAQRLVALTSRDRLLDSLHELVRERPSPADLVVQPFLMPEYAGGLLKSGRNALVEAVHGASPALFKRGLVSQRMLLTAGRITGFQVFSQEVALKWAGSGLREEPEAGWDRFSLFDIIAELAAALDRMDDGLLEWGMTGSRFVALDVKRFDDMAPFAPVAERPARVPPVIRSSSGDEATQHQPRAELRLLRPSLEYLSECRHADVVLIETGAVLAHLVTYSLEESYDCVLLAHADSTRS